MSKLFRNHYRRSLRRRAITDFIQENHRSPTKEQIFELVKEAGERYPGLNEVGYSSYDLVVPHYGEGSSASDDNQNKRARREDLYIVNQKISDTVGMLEDGYRAFTSTVDRCIHLNRSVDARLDNLLLQYGADVFTHGVEESFDTAEFIDMEKSDAHVHPGYASMGRRKLRKTNIDSSDIRVFPVARGGVLASGSRGSIDALLEEDGDTWFYEVHTDYALGEVSVVIEIDFREHAGIKLPELRITSDPNESNSRTFLTAFYSLNGRNYAAVEPTRTRLRKGENLFAVNQEGVEKVKLVMTKRAHDIKRGGKFVYIFALDSFEVLDGTYSFNKESTLYAGPYYVTDDVGAPINFSMATISHGTCCLVPGRTSVSFELSKDGEKWFPASWRGTYVDTIQFHNTNPAGTFKYLSEDVHTDRIISDVEFAKLKNIDMEHGREGLCNLYIDSAYADKFVLQNTKFKRNLPQGEGKIYNAIGGWFFDPITAQYNTVINIESLEGIKLNLGSTSAYIDDRLVTGEVPLHKGYHKFSTNQTNWSTLPVGIPNSDLLKEKDPNYPFNHRYIIEGYPYRRDFNGERVYNGVGEYFGSLLKYVTPERFNSDDLDGDLTIYTIDKYNNNLYFKVKIDPSDASWAKEFVKIDYMLRLDDTNSLYVKAILRTEDTAITPNISSFRVRVI